MKIKYILISKDSKYYSGKKTTGVKPETKSEIQTSVECHTGKGIVVDRYYNYKEDYKGQITFISYELHEKMQNHFSKDIDMADYRRNVFIDEGSLLELIGKKFKIGDVEFLGVEDCAPCAWMDRIIGEGSKQWMLDNLSGGLRAKVLSDGEISVGDELEKL